MKIAVTGGSGQIAYSLLFAIANGDLIKEKIHLSIHDMEEQMSSLKGVVMELEDSCFPFLEKISLSSCMDEVLEGADLALLIGAKPRGKGMQRADLIEDNGKIFQKIGKSLKKCSKDVLVFVVGNPCNTNCLIALHNAKNIDPKRFFAMTRLDQNRSIYQLAQKAKVSIQDVEDMIIWGNHSSTMVPDFFNAKIKKKKVVDLIEEKWLKEEFIFNVQKRGGTIIKFRGKSSAASACRAIIAAVGDLLKKEKKIFSSGIYSLGNPYGIDEDLIFSFPCRYEKEELKIAEDFSWNPFIEEMIKKTEKELIEERNRVHCLGFL